MALIDKYLDDYCNELLGELQTKLKTKSSKKSKKNKTVEVEAEQITKLPEIEKPESLKVTDDGFKICFDIPADDSDVSDAFESDNEDFDEVIPHNESKKKSKSENVLQTEDGFKIIQDIPSDDSDVSDAFESDLDENEWISEAKERLVKTNKNSNLSTDHPKEKINVLSSKLKNVKKPLLDLIYDFGLEEKFNTVQSNVETNSGKNCKKRKILGNEELSITDHSKKRGNKKKKTNLEQVKSDSDKIYNKNNEEALKQKKINEEALEKAKYEVYKLGTIGATTASGNRVEKKKAKIDLIVKLGAKPLKNKAVNYKQLIEIRKEKKEKDKIKYQEEREMGLQVKKQIAKSKRGNKIDTNPGIGVFKNGVLKLSKRDIESLNSS